jgi:signal transduction histidine kinase
MAVPDLSDLRALVADDRPEVRHALAARLRDLGVTRIDALPAGAGAAGLLAVMAGMPSPDDASAAMSPDQIVDVVARFTHDVTSPLTSALLLSRLLADTGGGDSARDDARRIHAAVEEVAGMVHTLIVRVTAASKASRPGAS